MSRPYIALMVSVQKPGTTIQNTSASLISRRRQETLTNPTFRLAKYEKSLETSIVCRMQLVQSLYFGCQPEGTDQGVSTFKRWLNGHGGQLQERSI